MSEKNASRFIAEALRSPEARSCFQAAHLNSRINQIITWLIGAESHRYAAEPVYAVTGKGKLVSEGIEGLEKKSTLCQHFKTEQGKLQAYRFIDAVEDELMAKAS